MNRVILITILIFFKVLAQGQDYQQIITKDSIQVDTFYTKYFIKDNYRWLENVHSTDTREWMDQQNKLSKKYLSKVTTKTNSFHSIDTYSYTEYDNPIKKGDYYFTYAYYDNLSVPALFYQTTLNEDAKILVNPNYISGKDKIWIKGYYVSKDSKLLAYQFNRNGSDWMEIKVVSLINRVDLKDHLKGIEFSGIAWMGNGFFYSTFSQNAQFGASSGQRIFYHTIGTEQQQDKLIFERKNNPSIMFDYLTTSDERFFIINENNIQKGIWNIFYIDYKSDQPVLKPLLTNLKEGIDILDSHNGKFIATTSKKSNNRSIVEIDLQNPLLWKTIAPEFSEALLLEAIPFNNQIIAIYKSNQHPIITAYDYSGKILHNLQMPVSTSIGGFSGNTTNDELLFNFQSYTIPPIVFNFNINTFNKELTKRTSVTYDYENIEYKEVEYLSKDSVSVPMVLVYEKGLKLDGTNPAILEAYGGFGIVEEPSFNPGVVYFIKHGGIYAFANIRGGGDKGVKWAKDGRGNKKQNSFDDFISAAQFLIDNKYTSRNKLAATGASNGGLVVAVAAIQRPDLFKAVVPIVAPLDMLRFEKFTIGHLHTREYGTIKDSVSFIKLLHYSPYHNIQEDINYPAMLIITSENDDRVPPFHSYKFVAKLQSRIAQKNPILLKIEMGSGHNGASTLMSSIKEDADIYGFILNELTKK